MISLIFCMNQTAMLSRRVALLGQGPRIVSRVKTPQNDQVSSQLSRALRIDSPEGINEAIREYLRFSESTRIDAKGISLFLHNLIKSKSLPQCSEEVKGLISLLRRQVVRNHRFTTSTSPLDITLILGAIARLSKQVPSLRNDIETVTDKLSNEIPVKLSLFEDHHLAQVLSSLSSLQYKDRAIVDKIINEIVINRNIDSLSPQSVVMISSSVSRLRPLDRSDSQSKIIQDFWVYVMNRASRMRSSEMQPNWPDVLLTSVAFSGIDSNVISPTFTLNMAKCTQKQIENRTISANRVSKAYDALVRLGADVSILNNLRKYCP